MAQQTAVPRSPEKMVASALQNKELMRQLDESLEAERRGEKDTPFREIQEENRQRRSA